MIKWIQLHANATGSQVYALCYKALFFHWDKTAKLTPSKNPRTNGSMNIWHQLFYQQIILYLYIFLKPACSSHTENDCQLDLSRQILLKQTTRQSHCKFIEKYTAPEHISQ